MKKVFLLVLMVVAINSKAQTKYYCAKSTDGKSKDLQLSFENGIKIEELGGVPMSGNAIYNSGNKDKIPITLEKVETAVSGTGKTGQRYYYYEKYENPSSARYIITEWPMGTEITYISKKKVKYNFACQDDANFDYTKPCEWAK
jgi:hypothetical protein